MTISPPAPRVVILEWVCCGGMLGTPIDQIPGGLLAEGQAMLCTLVDGLAAGGVSVSVPLDLRLFSAETLSDIAAKAHIIELASHQPTEWLPIWRTLAGECDWTWLVAPEVKDALCLAASHLRQAGGRLLNASGEFLRAASNKAMTAELLSRAAIPHPPTCSLASVDDAWLSRATAGAYEDAKAQNVWRSAAPQRWVIKPIDGAGGEGLQIVSRERLVHYQRSLQPAGNSLVTGSSPLIVQPYLDGIAASCSAVVTPSGSAHWLPLTSQDLSLQPLRESVTAVNSQSIHPEDLANPTDQRCGTNPWHPAASSPQTLVYTGCSYPPPGIERSAPRELLERTLAALPGKPLGWIGIDLLYQPSMDRWWVIEVNSRICSSLMGLAAGYGGNLVHDVFRLQTSDMAKLSSDFAPTCYKMAGTAARCT